MSYEKTSDPHPAINVNNRGEKSLAGLIGAPQLNPNEKTSNPKSVIPIAIGISPTQQVNSINNRNLHVIIYIEFKFKFPNLTFKIN